MEVWKSVLGYEYLYEVSNKGRVKSLEKFIINKYGGLSCRKEKILKQKISHHKNNVNRKDRVVCLTKDYIFRYYLVSRLVGIAFVPNPENKPEINHKDGDHTNNNDWNIEWNTRKENQQHAVRTGLQKIKKGEECSWSKVTKKQVDEIRAKYIPRKYTHKMLGEEYGISESTVLAIVRKINWK